MGLLLWSLKKLKGVWGHKLREVKGRSCTSSTRLGPGKTKVSRNFSSGKKNVDSSQKEHFVKSCLCQIVSF